MITNLNNFVNEFNNTPVEKTHFQNNTLRVGDPAAPLTINVFTDFLCSACYQFYNTEKYLITKFSGKINIIYHHYPLDQSCNPSVSKTIYPNSCISAQAMQAAAGLWVASLVLGFHIYLRLYY
jgi:hypothetical protein